jgi:1-deoxy-D-xylulose-5-phosphate synthase
MANSHHYSTLLHTINTPEELRRLKDSDLLVVAEELRQFLLQSVAKTGGHLSSNLGTVELTIALHYIFNTPYDRLIWDVGHQTYAHKILTGRREHMHTLRQLGGIAGFPIRTESTYDSFGTAHSSTSISAALGMAIASKIRHEKRHCIAVIGDGAMTAGMAFEAMNNGGIGDCNLLVILNDNDMSISPPVGALNRYLTQLISGRFYTKARNAGKKFLEAGPQPILQFFKRFEKQTKGMVIPTTLFEQFGFNYIGPIDGHDLESLVPTLRNVRELSGPQFLHVVTKKGQGYALAEKDPIAYHGPSKFNPDLGLQKKSGHSQPTFSQIFGQWICDMATQDKKLVAITPAMREGSGLVKFSEQFKERYFDVGIAEQHALTFAAGLACEGLKPVVAIYSTFLQRAYDQFIHDVALQKLPVVLAIDRAGVVGADGPTHMGAFDMTYLRCIPHISIACPADENETRQLLSTAYAQDHPVAVRYPRGTGIGKKVREDLDSLPFGKGEIIIRGQKLAILAFGTLLYPALEVAKNHNFTIANMRWVKPLDKDLIKTLASHHQALVTIEEGVTAGGAGSAVIELLQHLEINIPVLQLGLPDQFIEHGEPSKLIQALGLDTIGITKSITKRWPEFIN